MQTVIRVCVCVRERVFLHYSLYFHEGIGDWLITIRDVNKKKCRHNLNAEALSQTRESKRGASDTDSNS